MRITIHNFSGHRIGAIKSLRAIMGYGLREAKEIIDIVYGGVPSVIEGVTQVQADDLKAHGFHLNIDKEADTVDVINNLKSNIEILLNLKKYKAAQYVIDALEELENEDF